MYTHTYLFGTLEPKEEVSINKINIQKEIIKSGKDIYLENFKYRILEAKPIVEHGIEISKGNFIYGNLVKYREEFYKAVLNTTTSTISTSSIENAVVGESDFFYHLDSGVIAFREIVNRISRYQFIDAFCRLINPAFSGSRISININLIKQELGLIDALQKFSVINSIAYSIKPTNPCSKEIYKELDERLKKLGIELMNVIINARHAGINLDDFFDDDIFRAACMAEDGYGKYEVSGILDGNPLSIQSGEEYVSKRIAGKALPSEKFEKLYTIFQNYI